MRAHEIVILVALIVICTAITAAQAVTSQTNQFPPVAVGAWTDFSVPVGTSALQVLQSNTARKSLLLQNNSTGSVSCSDTNSSPTSLGLGTITIGSSPAAPVKFDGDFVPSGALYCIASTGTQNLTVKEGR